MPKTKIGLTLKAIIGVTILLIITGSILGLFFINHETRVIHADLQERGLSLVNSLAYNSEYGMLTGNISILSNLAEGVMKQPDVSYCIIQDLEGRTLVHTVSQEVRGRIAIPEEISKKVLGIREAIIQHFSITQGMTNLHYYDISAPVKSKIGGVVTDEKIFFEEESRGAERELGVVRVGLSLIRSDVLIEKVKRTIILMVAFIILIIVLATVLLARVALAPIKKLMVATQRISAGDLNFKVSIKTADEIEVLADSFNKMARNLQDTQVQLIQSAKMAAVGQLGAGVAHELNNPLGGILGYAQFILEKFRKPDFGIDDFKSCQRYIETIERESTRCKKIVESLLTFSRRPISAKPAPINISKAIEEVLSFTGHQLKLKNVKLITDFKPDLALTIGIINQLQQVFTNLILNAQEAMPEGGELRITAQNLIDEKTQIPSKVQIEFADTGCGISEEDLHHLFEPFFTTKGKEKGTGLGLSLSYQIIHDHKGAIEVKSQVGKGATFIITLPAVNE